jgi:HAD superfamily hydrolase (TIGR01509 family)
MPNINSYNTFIFDMDGTLVDLEKLNYTCLKQTVQKFFRVDLRFDQYQSIFSGARSADGFAKFIQIYSLDANINDLVLNFRAQKRIELNNNPGDVSQLIKGAKEYLERLVNEGKTLILATSTNREFAHIILKHHNIFHCFKYILTAEDVISGKPNPEIFLKAMTLTDSKPEITLIFEDSKSGIEAAKSSRAYCIGILTKGLNDEYVQEADYVIENYNSLLTSTSSFGKQDQMKTNRIQMR